ncbi:MAG: hypothetical protein J07HN4v3_00589, partial [Halonotius sp. J07HN4]
MAESNSVPRPDELETWYQLDNVRIDGDRIVYYGEPLIGEKRLHRELWPAFQEAGYDLKLARIGEDDRMVLVATPTGQRDSDGIPWLNIGLLAATLLSTLLIGAYVWYYIPGSTIIANPLSVLQAWPFTAAVLGVLLVHELGHYAMGRYHG